MTKTNIMKSLILHNYYTVKKEIVFSLFIFALAFGAFLRTENLYIFYGIVILLISNSTLSGSLYKDAISKWNQFQITMPLSRKDVVSSHYLGNILSVLIGIVLNVILVSVSAILGTIAWEDITTIIGTFLMGIGVTFFSGGINCLLFYNLGKSKSEFFGIIPLALASGTLAIFIVVGTSFGFTLNVASALYLAVSAILFGLSYFISLRIYAKKDL